MEDKFNKESGEGRTLNVFFIRKIGALSKPEKTSISPLKFPNLLKQSAISKNFLKTYDVNSKPSEVETFTRFVKDSVVQIDWQTQLLTSLNRSVIIRTRTIRAIYRCELLMPRLRSFSSIQARRLKLAGVISTQSSHSRIVS